MKNLLILITTTFLVQIGCTDNSIDYFGQSPPGNIPVVFAPGIISMENRFEFGGAFSNNNKEFYFSVTTSEWDSIEIYYSKTEDRNWTKPEIVPFSSGQELSPVFSSDGQSIFYSSHTDIYKADRDKNNWLKPVKVPLPVSSGSDEWTVRISDNGTLYFSSTRSNNEDIFRSKLINGQYFLVENLGNIINTEFSEDAPCIAPDESYIIFTSRRPGGYGDRDLYISFQKEDSTWTTPLNLGPEINKNCFNFSPYLSPDGKYLFFSRRYEWDSMDIYWVSTSIIDDLKKEN